MDGTIIIMFGNSEGSVYNRQRYHLRQCYSHFLQQNIDLCSGIVTELFS